MADYPTHGAEPADDDRYGWLDEEAAEQLLRGGPAMPAPWNLPESPRDRADADRLAGLLQTAARAGEQRTGGDGSLPGEEAALAAFRASRSAAGSRFRGRSRHADSGAPRFRPRPVRALAAVALTLCTAGGVAMTANGMVSLPSPFGPSTPAATSTPSGEHPEPSDSGDGSMQPSGGASGHPGGPNPQGKDSDKDSGKPSRADGGGSSHDPSQGSTGGGNPDPGQGGPGGGNGNGHGDGPSNDEILDQLCRAYLNAQAGKGDEPDRRAMRDLKKAAGGEKAITAFCEQRVGSTGGSNPSGGPSDSPQPSGPESPEPSSDAPSDSGYAPSSSATTSPEPTKSDAGT
ncbi:hypothetical protein [Streptomyces boninensis]|uniref:hypothetical protein n=1 Tax=Streptomyces boninensis TaxID=2039455 RepID=UPI003B214608